MIDTNCSPASERLTGRENAYAHRIAVHGMQIGGKIYRDNRPVKITRISFNEIKVGCTIITIAALKELLRLAEYDEKIIQDGDE